MEDKQIKTIDDILEGFEERFVFAARAKDGALLVESNILNVEIMQEHIRKEIEELLDELLKNPTYLYSKFTCCPHCEEELETVISSNWISKNELSKKLNKVRGEEKENK